MPDVTIIGGGQVVRECRFLLGRAGFAVRTCFDLEDSRDRSPVILGETPAPALTARQIVESGRHLLVANPLAVGPDRLGQLLLARRKNQALFLWSDRRYHPSFRFARGLTESDATWRPRFLRHESLLTEAPSPGQVRWRLGEAISLLVSLCGESPAEVSAAGSVDPRRASQDYIYLSLKLAGITAYLHLGLGEPVERRETLIAAEDRKATIDELNPTIPLRLIEGKHGHDQAGEVRWLSCSSPSTQDLIRQQCLAFLEGTATKSLADAEAALWQTCFRTLAAADASLVANGEAVRLSDLKPDAAGQQASGSQLVSGLAWR